jgi:hypothetical protein
MGVTEFTCSAFVDYFRTPILKDVFIKLKLGIIYMNFIDLLRLLRINYFLTLHKSFSVQSALAAENKDSNSKMTFHPCVAHTQILNELKI